MRRVCGCVGVYVDVEGSGVLCARVQYSVILGLLSGMDSLGSQAYGSGNLKRVGVLYQRSLIVCFGVMPLVGAENC